MAKWQILVSALIGASTIGAGIWQFHEDSQQRRKIARFEARKPFLVKQMELCFQASEAASTLASSTNLESWQHAKETFWMLYWGPLAVVEKPVSGEKGSVEIKMIAFGDALKPLQGGPALPLESLKQKSLTLAHKCRELIFGSWDISRTE